MLETLKLGIIACLIAILTVSCSTLPANREACVPFKDYGLVVIGPLSPETKKTLDRKTKEDLKNNNDIIGYYNKR